MTGRAVVALVLSVVGIACDMLYTGQGPAAYWPPALVFTVGVPLLVVAASFTGAAKPVAVVAALPFTLLALVLTPWGYGFWQLPTAGALWWTVAGRRRQE